MSISKRVATIGLAAAAAFSCPGATSAATKPPEQTSTIVHAQSGKSLYRPSRGSGGSDDSDEPPWWGRSRDRSGDRSLKKAVELTYDEQEPGRQWRFFDLGSGYFQIQSPNGGCLAVRHTNRDTYVVTETCQRSEDDQKWERKRSGTANNRWLLLNDSTGKAMQPERNSRYAVLREQTDADGQQWLLPGWRQE